MAQRVSQRKGKGKKKSPVVGEDMLAVRSLMSLGTVSPESESDDDEDGDESGTDEVKVNPPFKNPRFPAVKKVHTYPNRTMPSATSGPRTSQTPSASASRLGTSCGVIDGAEDPNPTNPGPSAHPSDLRPLKHAIE